MKLSNRLIEIFLIFITLGIFASILIYGSNLRSQLMNLDKSRQIFEMNILKEVIDAYYLATFSYPEGVNEFPKEICDTNLETKFSEETNCAGYIDLRMLVPDYISAIPSSRSSAYNQTGYYVSISESGRIAVQKSTKD